MKYLFIFMVACLEKEHLKQLDVSNCKVLCYEKSNDAPVYQTACSHMPSVSVGEDSAYIRIPIRDHFFDSYRPFDKIAKNLDKYDECYMIIKPKGRFR